MIFENVNFDFLIIYKLELKLILIKSGSEGKNFVDNKISMMIHVCQEGKFRHVLISAEIKIHILHPKVMDSN